MVDLYSTNLTVTQGQAITWNNKAAQVGSSVTLDSDGQTINLNSSGVYSVTVNSYGSTNAAGSFGYQLYGDGNAVIRGAASASTTAEDINTSVAFSTLIVVSAALAGNKAKLVLNYTGSAGTVALVNVVVRKVA